MEKYKDLFILLLCTVFICCVMFIGCEEDGDDDDDTTTDTTTPEISVSYPENGATGVPINLQYIAIGFNEFMDDGSSNSATFSLVSGNPEWYTYNEDDDHGRFSVVIIGVDGLLNSNMEYTITLNRSSSGMNYEDLAGNKLAADTTITFTTGTDSAPTVLGSSCTPQDNATNVSTGLPVFILTFSEPMTGGNSFHPGVPYSSNTWENSNQEIHYVVDGPLNSNTEYRAVVNPFGHNYNVQSSATGLPVAPYTIIHFTTGS